VDVVIDLTPSFISVHVMEAALALNAHYVNTAACPEHLAQLIQGKPLDLGDKFVAAGKSALLGCGATPGVLNVICRRFCDELDTVERIEIRAGFHVPAQKEMVKTWMPNWCPEQQYFDYAIHRAFSTTAGTNICRFFMSRRLMISEAISAKSSSPTTRTTSNTVCP
jgi:saccharopine dehydrogenase-like NADP-dependent oxidoreductase